MLTFGATLIALAASDFLHVGGAIALALGSAQECPIPKDGLYLNRISVVHNGLGAGAGSVTYTLVVNGVDSTLAVTLAVGGAFATFESPTTVVLREGDRVSLRADKVGAIVGSPTGIIVCVG